MACPEVAPEVDGPDAAVAVVVVTVVRPELLEVVVTACEVATVGLPLSVADVVGMVPTSCTDAASADPDEVDDCDATPVMVLVVMSVVATIWSAAVTVVAVDVEVKSVVAAVAVVAVVVTAD